MSASDYLPLKPTYHLTLLLLAEEPTYGVRLVERLEEKSGGAIRVNAGSLYRMIAALVDDGLVAPAEAGEDPGGVGAPRKIYEITERGLRVLRAEMDRQADLLEMARSLDLAVDGS